LKTIPPAKSEKELRGNLAICLVIVDSLPHEDIWRAWLGDVDIAGSDSICTGALAAESDAHTSESQVSSCATDNADNRFRARLFIHAKHPEKITSPWVQSCLIPAEKCHKPEWNSPEVKCKITLSLYMIYDSLLS
jgi:hypothetical protein